MLRARVLIAGLILPSAVLSQSLDLMVNNTGLSIGDSRIVHGVRLNYRDDRLERVVGINATLWTPYDRPRGHVTGLALGLPATGARRIEGIGIGVFGVGAESEFKGIGLGGFGVGAGGDATGILVGGLGVGAGGNVRGLTFGTLGAGAGGSVSGITVAGLGAGAGGNVKGITIAGLGAGAGGDVKGITIGVLGGAGAGGNMTGFQFGGIGVGAGGNVTGISAGIIGAGAGGDITGLTVAGVGAGAGGDVTGITIAGVGAGAGGTLRGWTISGVGAGAPRVRGVITSILAAGGVDVEGLVVAPAYFRIESPKDGELGRVKGVTISAFNRIQGEQFGLSLGLINYAWELNGWQVGLINIAKSNRKLRWFPLVNYGGW